MRAEPPDQLTGAVWQMLANARASAMTREEATEQAILFLRRNLSYLARRARRGHHTNYNEVLERDLEAVARLVVLLEPPAEPPLLPADGLTWIRGQPPPLRCRWNRLQPPHTLRQKAWQNMRLSINEVGIMQIDLESADAQIVVNIGQWTCCTSGTLLPI
jgi:hypothetical protein